jgi:hypothetical protein
MIRRCRWAGIVAAVAIVPPVAAHEWYPPECCHDLDCAPVERAEPLADGAWQLTSKVGTTVVPASFPRRESPDDRMHVCMARFSHLDGMRPVCLFVPREVTKAWPLTQASATATSGVP